MRLIDEKYQKRFAIFDFTFSSVRRQFPIIAFPYAYCTDLNKILEVNQIMDDDVDGDDTDDEIIRGEKNEVSEEKKDSTFGKTF